MEKRNRKYHRENCDNRMRDMLVDTLGRTIILSGQHAFEWSITICSHNVYTKTTYKNGKEARKQFKKYKNKY